MRVFYIDEEEPKNNYYVKFENVNLPDGLKGYKAFEATTTEELISEIKKFYGFKNVGIELWGGQRHISERLDILDIIPKYKEFISAYIVVNNK